MMLHNVNFSNILEKWLDSLISLISGAPNRIENSISHDDAIINILGAYSLITAIIFVAFMFMLYRLLSNRKFNFWKLAACYLPTAFTIVWFLGFVVYDVGMCTEERISLLRNAPMAVLHAFEMFLLQSDVSSIHSTFHNNSWYMGIFSIAHFLAALVTLVFVVKLFGFQITNGIRRAFASHLSRQRILYIFWGMNEQSFLLAKSIISRHESEIRAGKKENKSYRLVVVRTNHDDEQQSVSPNGLDRMFNFLSIGGREFERLQELCGNRRVYTTSTYADISKKDVSGENKNEKVDAILTEKNFFTTMRLHSIYRFIRHTSEELHIFCLDSDEDDNLQATSTLKHMLNTSKSGLSIKLYCHARRDGIKRVIEDTTLMQPNMEVRVIDSSHLAVEQLRQDAEAQPVRFVEVEPDGTVSSPFNALVIGFGETGRDAVRFLYEFGAFVDSKSTDDNVRRSPFLCHIVDSNMESLEPKFINGCPETGKHLSFLNADYRSEESYNLLKKIAAGLNYVVISLDDDEKNIGLAVDILRYVKTHRKNMEKFCIYVRAYHQHRIDHLEKISEYYNKSYEAPNVIRIFGKPQDIYTDELIVHDAHSEAARKFYDTYQQCNTQDNVFLSEGTWDDRRLITLGLASKEFFKTDGGEVKMRVIDNPKPRVPCFNKVQKLRRKESQDRSNSLHCATKKYILHTTLKKLFPEKNVPLSELKRMGSGADIKYVDKSGELKETELSKLNNLLLNLARTEHLRWNAAHELLGYKHNPGNKKGADDEKKTHNCLVPWEQLDEISKNARAEWPIEIKGGNKQIAHYTPDYKAYDFAVVDTTLRLYAEEQNEQNKKD